MNKMVVRVLGLTMILFTSKVVVAMTTTDLYKKYQEQTDHKAFAIGLNNISGASWGATTQESARDMALKTCKKSGGKNCSITEVDGKPWSSNSPQDSRVNMVTNYNIMSNGVSYIPDLIFAASGFFVNKYYIVTTSEAVEKCTKINFERNGKLINTIVIRVDKVNGIAVLKSSEPSEISVSISSKRKTTQGDRTYAYGYDLSDLINSQIPSYQGKITDGIISLASGDYNDIRYMSITNSLSKGNTGGPVLSESGEVVGLVTSTDKQVIKSSILSIFLDEQGISYKEGNTKKLNVISPSSIARSAQKYSVPIVCLNRS
ncbi:trypsin-like peptidase domain-containing protein [Vibrio gazogenes]|uniref:DUF4189 domain-containing protein n=1 Tax=Vibrio gazogenes TaxID=687 RepID=A0A1Z2SB51_VIBGA|nr:trypsin-like peptidase domain-containing protein [Vibrio gazogenes]ASA54402.1 hypothetical protein BSQ33_00780 [Vibrio gazogenes]